MNRLDFLFFSERGDRKYIPRHVHECYEMVYYFGGQGESKIGDKNYSFENRSFAVISPHVAHDERHITGGEVLFIGFHSTHQALKDINGIFKDGSQQNIQRIMLQMKEEFVEQQYGYTDILDLLVGELIIHLERIIGPKRHAKHTDNPFQYVLNYMDEHYRQKISIELLAQMSGYSYDRFRHLFKEKYSMAPLQYLFQRRFDFAKSQLLETTKPVSEIALNAGFVNDAQFCSMFKRETGMTPRAFRHQGVR